MALITFNLVFEGSQEVPPHLTPAFGTGTITFDTVTNTASYVWNITGIDFGVIDGQTPATATTDDDATGFHFHNNARGVNGPIVFDIPTQDNDDLQVVQGVGNSWTISGVWEPSDPANTSINSFEAILEAATLGNDVPLYANIHTALFPGGAIRAQWVNAPCYCRGTLILTDRGEMPVENLAIGDNVMTTSGAARPIKWIGRRAYDPRFVSGNRNILPIRIEAGALAHGVPARDLWVSPEHALFIRNMLVPARLLANGATIRQVEIIDRLEYFHIELDTHDLILAEGTPAETFVDCDNRGMFHNGSEFAALYPGDTPTPWQFCAPRAEEGSAELTAIRRMMVARAKVFSRITSDPDLHLVVDGKIVRAQFVRDQTVYRFAIPAGARSVSIASRSAVPAEVEISSTDHRRLGVAVARIVLCGPGLRIEIGHDCPTLSNGFHEDEAPHRWTDGRGCLPEAVPASFGSDFVMEVHLNETELRYGLPTPAAVTSLKSSKSPDASRALVSRRERRAS